MIRDSARSAEATGRQGGGRYFLVRLRPYYRQVAGLLVVGSVAGIAMNVAIVLPAVFLGRALDVVLAYQHHQVSAGRVAVAAALFVAATAATQLPRIGKRWWLDLARARFRANVRADALRGVLSWPMERLAELSVGGVMARVIGDVEVLGVGVGEVIVETWDTLLFSISMMVTMFAYSPVLAVLALAPVPAALWLAKMSGRTVAVRTVASREAAADLTSVLREQLGGIRLLRLAGRSGTATTRVGDLAARQAAAELDAIRVDEGLSALYSVVLGAGVLFIIWLGGREVAAGTLSVGGLVAFLQLFARFIGRAPRIPQMVNRVQAAGAAYARLEPLLAPPVPARTEPRWSSLRSVRVAGGERPLPVVAGGRPGPVPVRFEGVTFTYPGAGGPALSGVDLEVSAGSFVAVTGAVGSGKSALARLAAGIYVPQAGRVLLGDVRATDVPPSGRAGLIGYLGQDPYLFSGTVAANIGMDEGDSPGEAERLRWASTLAALEADLDTMPAGLATEVGELGVRLSGGQRQRVGLARALAAGGAVPGLLVLDDPFSAVDVHTEAAIVEHLLEAVREGRDGRATLLLFSHRLGAFPRADHVVLLDAGRIVEQGRHADLVSAGGRYARIFGAQSALDQPELPELPDRSGRA